MDRAATVATWVDIAPFGGLAILCLRVSRRGRRQAAWAAASGFAVLREVKKDPGEYWAGLASLPEAPAT